MYVFAENEQEAKDAVQDQMCHSIEATEVEEWASLYEFEILLQNTIFYLLFSLKQLFDVSFFPPPHRPHNLTFPPNWLGKT